MYDIKANNCLVYSFGINNEWSFDDGVASYGCKVFAFDPSMKAKEHKRGKNIHFYPIGIGDQDTSYKYKYLTMKSIIKFLNHDKNDVIIDYLKMDVEGAEVGFFQETYKNNPDIMNKFKQIGLEIHPGPYRNDLSRYKKLYEIFMKLEDSGYRLMFSAPNPVPQNNYLNPFLNKVVNGYYELVWAKVK